MPIVQAATPYQSEYTRQTYILILSEALWIGGSMQHTLVNPNQQIYYGTKVQDDPTSSTTLHIMIDNSDFNMELTMKGTVIFVNTFTPSVKTLHDCPHTVLNSPHERSPQKLTFRNQSCNFADEIEQHYNISAIDNQRNNESIDKDSTNVVFNIASINSRIINSVNIKQIDNLLQSDRIISSVERKKYTESDTPQNEKTLDIGDASIPRNNVF